MKIKKNSTLLFVGDSITDCGRGHPVGEGENLGDGYVSIINENLTNNYPENKIQIINTGVGGDRVVDLEARWQTDVLDLKPDYLSIKIGINDVWRQFDSVYVIDQISKNVFEKVYEKLIRKTLPTVKGLILVSPYYIESDKNEPMRKMMDEYLLIVKMLAEKYNLPFVNTQEGFDEYLKVNTYGTLTLDKVHPNRKGHDIIADCFLKTVLFD